MRLVLNLFLMVPKRDSGWELAYDLLQALFGTFGVLTEVLVVTACAPLVDRSIVKQASRVNQATSYRFNTDSVQLVLILSIEELDLLESSASVFVAMPQGEGGSIAARIETVQACSSEGVDRATFDLNHALLWL